MTITVADRVSAVLAANKGLTQKQIAKQAGMSDATLSALLKGIYPVKGADMLDKLEGWLKTREEGVEARALAGGPGDQWLSLPTANDIKAVMKLAQSMCAWGIVYKGAGVGKTVTARHYQSEKKSNVWIFTADPFRNSEKAVLYGLYRLVTPAKDQKPGLSRAELSDEIVIRISKTQGLLIIDEAQYLSIRTLNGIRVLTDGHVGVVLLGNGVVRTRMDSIRTSVDMEPVYSRVIGCLELPTAKPGDITSYLRAWGIEDKAITKFAHEKIPQSVGALRSLRTMLQIATTMAAVDGHAVDLRYVDKAWSKMEIAKRDGVKQGGKR